jgi:hypothetical protein
MLGINFIPEITRGKMHFTPECKDLIITFRDFASFIDYKVLLSQL